MSNNIRDKYHIAVNTVGYMLRGAPNTPAYTKSVIPSTVNRLAISDVAYSDFAGQGIFYLAQTDWSGGIKGETLWRDDGKYYYASNIDALTKNGSFQIASGFTLENDFTPDIQCANYIDVGGTSYPYMGSSDGLFRKSAGTWSNISSGWDPATYSVTDIISHKAKLWATAINATSHRVVSAAADGSGETDHSTAIETAMGWTASKLDGAITMWENGITIYVAVINSTEEKYGIASSDDNGATWNEVVDFTGNVNTGQGADFILSGISFGTKQFYLVNKSFGQELRVYDSSTPGDLLLFPFYGSATNINKVACARKFLHILNGKLIVTIPNREVYEYDLTTGDLNRIFIEDDEKYNASESSGITTFGGVMHKQAIYWNNLIYDGKSFFNNKRANDDSYTLKPLMSDGNVIYWADTADTTKLWKDSGFKSGSDANFMVLNEMSPVSSIEKLFQSVTLIFDQLTTAESIKISYSKDNRSSFVDIGTVSYSSDGALTSKTFIIPGNILFNKLWLKVFLNGNGSTTPTINDVVIAYRPMPDYKTRWQMRLELSDGVKLLNKQNDNRKGDDMNSQLWNEKIVKRQVKFQDIDYIECNLLTTMTKTQTSAKISAVHKLPFQGRIRAVSGNIAEEMYYTSAKLDRILGITRGARGTTARAYLSGQTLDNGYNVYVEDIITNLNFTDEKDTESIAQVLLIES